MIKKLIQTMFTRTCRLAWSSRIFMGPPWGTPVASAPPPGDTSGSPFRWHFAVLLAAGARLPAGAGSPKIARMAMLIGEIFRRNAEVVPNRVAASLGDETLTHRQLDGAANRMARALRGEVGRLASGDLRLGRIYESEDELGDLMRRAVAAQHDLLLSVVEPLVWQEYHNLY